MDNKEEMRLGVWPLLQWKSDCDMITNDVYSTRLECIFSDHYRA